MAIGIAVLTVAFKFEILKCDHSNESFWAVLSCCTVYYAVQDGSNFSVCGLNTKVLQCVAILNKSYWEGLSRGTVALTGFWLAFKFVDGILKCDHSDESYWAVLSWGIVYYAVRGGSNFWFCGWNPKVSDEIYWAVLSCGTVCLMLHKVLLLNFLCCGWSPVVWQFKWNLFGYISKWCNASKIWESSWTFVLDRLSPSWLCIV